MPISNIGAERSIDVGHHFINEVICDELGRRHQLMDPQNYAGERLSEVEFRNPGEVPVFDRIDKATFE